MTNRSVQKRPPGRVMVGDKYASSVIKKTEMTQTIETKPVILLCTEPRAKKTQTNNGKNKLIVGCNPRKKSGVRKKESAPIE